MTDFTSPQSALSFQMAWGGDTGSFGAVSGLEDPCEAVDIVEDGDNTVRHKLPRPNKFSPVVLQYGTMSADSGCPKQSNLGKAWPLRVRLAMQDAKASQAAVDEIAFVFSTLQNSIIKDNLR